MRITSAPKSDSKVVVYGPAQTRVMSRILIPSRGSLGIILPSAGDLTLSRFELRMSSFFQLGPQVSAQPTHGVGVEVGTRVVV